MLSYIFAESCTANGIFYTIFYKKVLIEASLQLGMCANSVVRMHFQNKYDVSTAIRGAYRAQLLYLHRYGLAFTIKKKNIAVWLEICVVLYSLYKCFNLSFMFVIYLKYLFNHNLHLDNGQFIVFITFEIAISIR